MFPSSRPTSWIVIEMDLADPPPDSTSRPPVSSGVEGVRAFLAHAALMRDKVRAHSMGHSNLHG